MFEVWREQLPLEKTHRYRNTIAVDEKGTLGIMLMRMTCSRFTLVESSSIFSASL